MYIEVRNNNLISWAKYKFKENLQEIDELYTHLFDNNYEIVNGTVNYKNPEENETSELPESEEGALNG